MGGYLIKDGQITTADCLFRYHAGDPQLQVRSIAVLTWAGECRQIFKKEVYCYHKDKLPEFTRPYLLHSVDIARRQLLLAGLRLAISRIIYSDPFS